MGDTMSSSTPKVPFHNTEILNIWGQEQFPQKVQRSKLTVNYKLEFLSPLTHVARSSFQQTHEIIEPQSL